MPAMQGGELVPLSDVGSLRAAIPFKACAYTNRACGFIIKIRHGDIHIDEPITHASRHPGHTDRDAWDADCDVVAVTCSRADKIAWMSPKESQGPCQRNRHRVCGRPQA
jgi:hypothetical protein